jgi:PEP-CTERM motif
VSNAKNRVFQAKSLRIRLTVFPRICYFSVSQIIWEGQQMVRFKKLAVTTACAAIGMWFLPMRAGALVTTFLYNGSGTQTPQSQGWLSFADNAIFGDGTPVTTSTSGATTLDTTGANNNPTSSSNIEAGYSNYTALGSMVNGAFPALNPTTGFSVSFDVAINLESHGTDTDRAGFDVIVLGSDKKGVELGFWSNDIWAQQFNPGMPGTFTRDGSEDSNIQRDTTALNNAPSTHYTLTITGTSYSLSTGTGSPVTILTGTTHDYTGSAMLPYTLANYVFIGDDTTDAQASETFTDLAVTVVPEPATASGLVGLGLAALSRRRRK